MPLYLKDREADALAREVAALTGETLTQTVRNALRERLDRERLKRSLPVTIDDLQDMFADFDALPVLDDRTADEIIGYDENGLPT